MSTAAGVIVRGAGPDPTVVVAGLTNGETFQCVAYAENGAGRSAASPVSASFTPCGGLLGCNPWIVFVLAGIVAATRPSPRCCTRVEISGEIGCG